jgi:SAM-dependent methyltransferase
MRAKDQQLLYEHTPIIPHLEVVKLSKIKRAIALLPRSRRPLRVLDVACNDGFHASLFPGPDFDYYGVDIIRVKKGNPLAGRIKQADITLGFPYKDNMFDVILASEILEHVFDTDFMVAECSRVLKKGGTLILTTPNTVPLHARFMSLLGARPYSVDARVLLAVTPGHIRAFILKDIREIFSDNGFRIDRVFGLDVPFVPGGVWIANHFPTISSGFIVKATNIKTRMKAR